MRIPLFVSASGILVLLAIGFGWTFLRLGRVYDRRYVHEWGNTWTALGLYALLSGSALLAVNLEALQPFRSLLSASAIAAAWWHLHSLRVGMHALCLPEAPRGRILDRIIAVAMLGAVVLALTPTEPQSDRAFVFYVGRMLLLALAWGSSYLAAGLQILRRRPDASFIARTSLGVSMISYAVLRLLEPTAHFVREAPVLAQFLTFGGLPLLVGMGGGMLMTLLEVERAEAVREAEARITAERSATASEATLAAALATSLDPVFIVDRDGALIEANPVFFELATLATGRALPIGTRIVETMDQEVRHEWQSGFSRALAGEPARRQALLRLSPSEARRRFSVRFTPVQRAGSIIGVLVVAHDTTEEQRLRGELERREEWFRALIENASDMIFQLAADTSIEYASPSVKRILGYEHTSLVGRPGLEFIHPEDAPTVADALRRSLAHDETVPTVVPFRARAATGEYLPLEGVSRPYAYEDGSQRLIVALRDVRERRRLEDELVSARRLEAVGRLAGGVAHDFNNLLTAVAGNVQLLREREDADPSVASQLDEIDQSVHRGAELTRRLLAFARQQVIEPRVLRVPDLVRDLERLLRRLLPDSILLDIDVPDTLWSLRADHTAFEQILVNLVVNARDAMPKGGSLRLSATNFTVGLSGHEALDLTTGEWVRLDIADTGVGIAPDVIGRIFEPFYTTKEGSGGTGLGLATVYGAATQMGGKVQVQSELGRGTTFSLFFPRVIAPAETAAEPERPTMPRAKDGEVIILMEDETPVRDVTAKLLRKLGYEVLTAVDGESGVALAAARPERIDLILSDIMMPGIHGDVAAARIRAARPQTPVLFISGFSKEALRWTTGMPPGSKLLQKPFTLEDLAAAIRDLLDGPRR